MNIDKAKANVIEVCNFFHKLDLNSCMLDDLDERMQPENIEFEIQNLMDITKDWFANGYLDVAETGWLIGKLNDASEYMNS
jgi:hypothetical protein